jgi:hypothetical protein
MPASGRIEISHRGLEQLGNVITRADPDGSGAGLAQSSKLNDHDDARQRLFGPRRVQRASGWAWAR